MDTNHAHERLGVISLLLAQKILELFIVLLAGFVATRVGLIHAEYASALSVMTTLVSIVTMPLMVQLYLL